LKELTTQKSLRITVFVLRLLIGSVWLVNGLFCKVLGWAPRHREIVATILGEEHSLLLTRLIGVGEIGLALWIWSGVRARCSAALQMLLVGTMNVMEFFLAPESLMWGKFNALFAAAFIALIWIVEWRLNRRPLGDDTT